MGKLGGKVGRYGRTEVSLRDIIRVISDAAKDVGQYLETLARRVETYPSQYLLIDSFLAYVNGDVTDAILYEDHAFNILGYDCNFHLLLLLIYNHHLEVTDPDIGKLLANLYLALAPPSLDVHIDRYGEAYKRRVDRMQRLVQEYMPGP